MNTEMYTAFCAVREAYKKLVHDTGAAYPALRDAQTALIAARGAPAYTVDTPVVYNTALDGVTANDEIRLILTGDNPGRREQDKANRAYLVGPSGKIAARFINDKLGMDFRKNVLILNKTPVHTPRTAELKDLEKRGGEALTRVIDTSQEGCAENLYQFWRVLSAGKKLPVWIIGYSEMHKKGVFKTYTQTLIRLARADSAFYNELYLYRHFSMNQFTIDLNKKRQAGEALNAALERIGREYRERVLG
jgi:hypothetical protein